MSKSPLKCIFNIFNIKAVHSACAPKNAIRFVYVYIILYLCEFVNTQIVASAPLYKAFYATDADLFPCGIEINLGALGLYKLQELTVPFIRFKGGLG